MLSFFDIQETIFQQSCCIFFNLLGETNPMTLSQTTLERVRKTWSLTYVVQTWQIPLMETKQKLVRSFYVTLDISLKEGQRVLLFKYNILLAKAGKTYFMTINVAFNAIDQMRKQ